MLSLHRLLNINLAVSVMFSIHQDSDSQSVYHETFEKLFLYILCQFSCKLITMA